MHVRVIETERLVLRHFAEEDAEFMLDLLNQPSFHQFIGDRGVRTVDEARAYIRKGPIASYESLGFGPYLVELKAEPVAIGLCGLLKRESLPYADLGFAFLPRFWSRGYAYESASAMLRKAAEELRLPRVLAITSRDNAASIRLLGKLGFAEEGTVTLSAGVAPLRLFGLQLAD